MTSYTDTELIEAWNAGRLSFVCWDTIVTSAKKHTLMLMNEETDLRLAYEFGIRSEIESTAFSNTEQLVTKIKTHILDSKKLLADSDNAENYGKTTDLNGVASTEHFTLAYDINFKTEALLHFEDSKTIEHTVEELDAAIALIRKFTRTLHKTRDMFSTKAKEL